MNVHPNHPPSGRNPATPSQDRKISGLLPLIRWRRVVLWFAYGWFVWVTGSGALHNFGSLLWVTTGGKPPPFYENVPISFATDFWSLAAALLFGLVIINPGAWLNGPRLVIGTTAFAMMLASITGSLWLGLASALPIDGFTLFLLTPLLLAAGGAFAIVVLGFAAVVFFGFVVGVPVALFNQILAFDNALQVYRYQARGLAGYIVKFVFWLRNEPLPNIPNDSRGARFATSEEAARLHDPRGMGFGHIDGQLLQLHTDKHVLIMASTRSGKGVALIVPHLLRYEGSAFVLDPKGENAKATGRQRAALNDKVFYLDPFGISGKPQARFNPMSRLTPQNVEAESKALAAALFIPAEGEKRDHWFNGAQQLFALIIMFVYLSPQIPKAKKDLLTARRLLLGSLKPTLEAMLPMDEADGLLRDVALSFLNTPEKELGSIVSVAQRQTDILDNPEMIACLSASGQGQEVDFGQWHSGTMTVFLCLSAPKFPVFNRWLRLVLTSALDEMTDKLNPPPLPVAFMLDELATLGHFQPIENAIGLAAGYGVQLICVFQDVAQMRDLYKSRWASFIGNAGVRALFNLDDFDSAKYWSNFIGGHLVETRGRQEDNYGLSQGQNVGEAMRPLLSPDELMLYFGRNKMLVLPQASRPIIAERVAYWNDTTLNGLWDDPRQPATSDARRPVPPASPPPASPPSPKGPRPPSPPFKKAAAQNAATTAQEKEPAEVDRYQSGDILYVMFDDGSVEVRAPTGASRYPSLQALREAAATPEAPPSEQIIDP